MQFKYFLDPEKYASILKGEHECDICHQRRKCFDGKRYHFKLNPKDFVLERKKYFPDPKKMKNQEHLDFIKSYLARERAKQPKAFCFECVAKGRLLEVGAFGITPHYGALKRQLQIINPKESSEKIDELARKITDQFRGSTPTFATWQDWNWPAHCGDYCQFITLAGQYEFNRIATDGKGKELFRNSLYEDLKENTNVNLIWSRLKPDQVVQEENWSPLAYIFKCLNCGAILTIWDAH